MYLLGALYVFVVMRFGFGPASLSMQYRPEYDLNIYYLVGRGWMEGLIPYQDLADLKGPLVFLLHGVGAWLTPGRFLGACLLESLLLGVGVLFAYRSARLYFSLPVSCGILGLYSVSMLYFSLHPAELVWVLQQVTLYYLLRYGTVGRAPGWRAQLVLGASAAVVLLVKFNLAAFWLPFCLWGVIAAGRRWWRALLVQTLGVTLPLGLVGGCFYQMGALEDMWREYIGVALQYGGCVWGESALATRGWLLASELLPLHLHTAMPEPLAASLGWLCLLPCVFLPVLIGRPACRLLLPVLLASFVLALVANYGGAHCYIHYAFGFSVYLLLGIMVLARLAKQVIPWVGACVALAAVLFAVGLPVASRLLKPDSGNAEMSQTSHELGTMLASGEDLLVLDVRAALHLHRLSGTLPHCPHFIPSMVRGGMAQHREELASCIRKRSPRYILSTTASADMDAALLSDEYRRCDHATLGLPAFPETGKYPEFVLYIRKD